MFKNIQNTYFEEFQEPLFVSQLLWLSTHAHSCLIYTQLVPSSHITSKQIPNVTLSMRPIFWLTYLISARNLFSVALFFLHYVAHWLFL